MYPYTGIGRGARHQQDAETVRQRRSRIVQRLNVSDFLIWKYWSSFPFAKTHSRRTVHTKCGMYLLPLRCCGLA